MLLYSASYVRTTHRGVLRSSRLPAEQVPPVQEPLPAVPARWPDPLALLPAALTVTLNGASRRDRARDSEGGIAGISEMTIVNTNWIVIARVAVALFW